METLFQELLVAVVQEEDRLVLDSSISAELVLEVEQVLDQEDQAEAASARLTLKLVDKEGPTREIT